MEKKILICDDSPEILEVCKIVLEQYDFVVATAARCDNIIKTVEQVNPHLILLDLFIAPLGGRVAFNQIRNNKSTAHIPIVFFSATNNLESISKDEEVDGYLIKPFNITDLIKIVNDKMLPV